jgi:hypothetical protein
MPPQSSGAFTFFIAVSHELIIVVSRVQKFHLFHERTIPFVAAASSPTLLHIIKEFRHIILHVVPDAEFKTITVFPGTEVGDTRPYTPPYSTAAFERTSLEPENAARKSAVEIKKNITRSDKLNTFLFISGLSRDTTNLSMQKNR